MLSWPDGRVERFPTGRHRGRSKVDLAGPEAERWSIVKPLDNRPDANGHILRSVGANERRRLRAVEPRYKANHRTGNLPDEGVERRRSRNSSCRRGHDNRAERRWTERHGREPRSVRDSDRRSARSTQQVATARRDPPGQRHVGNAETIAIGDPDGEIERKPRAEMPKLSVSGNDVDPELTWSGGSIVSAADETQRSECERHRNGDRSAYRGAFAMHHVKGAGEIAA